MLLNNVTEGKFENGKFQLLHKAEDIELTIRVSAIEAQHRLGEANFHAYNLMKWKRQIDGFLMDIYLGIGNSALSSLVCDESISLLKSYTLPHGGPDTYQNLEKAMKDNPLFLKTLHEHFQSNVGGERDNALNMAYDIKSKTLRP